MERDIISIGYSLGILENGESITGAVETSSEIVTLDFTEFSVWQLISKYGNKEKLQRKFKEIFQKEDLDEIILSLKEKNLIMELGGDLDEVYEDIKSRRLFRQGYGIGRHDECENMYKISLENNKLDIGSIEFSLWTSANNKITVEDIYDQFREAGLREKDRFILDIFKLYKKNLVYIL